MSPSSPSAVLDLLAKAPIPPPVADVLSRLQLSGYQAFLVGGCVRDLVWGRLPKDYDVATSARPEQVQAVFKKVIPTGIAHGTVTVVTRGQHVEVTTFRSEGDYVDGRRPSSVAFQTEIREDLSRRDFTINAMAYDPVRKELVDPFSGQEDLAARVVRAVGDPMLRFSEDGLRCLRAARFAAVLGFSVDPKTLASIAPCLPVFRKVASERVRDELSKLLLSDHPDLGLSILSRSGLLKEVVPELPAEAFEQVTRAVCRSVQALEVRLAVFLLPVGADAASVILKRLTFPNRVIQQTSQLLRHPLPDGASQWGGEAIRRWAAALGTDSVGEACAVAEAVGTIDMRALGARIRAELDRKPPLTAKDLAFDGKKIMEVLGVGPSPKVGEATRFLLDRVLERPELNTQDGLEALLRGFMKP